jgi:hypothetical protein
VNSGAQVIYTRKRAGLKHIAISIGLFQKKNAWGQRRLFNNFFSCGMVSKVGYLSMSTKFLHGVVKMFHFC